MRLRWFWSNWRRWPRIFRISANSTSIRCWRTRRARWPPQLDYARAMAFVAFDEATSELLGVVRIHSDSIYESGEYAILLRSDLKGRGLGWTLMQMIIEYATSEGLKVISGDVLAENTVMLAMCRNLGFQVKAEPDEHDICNVRLAL